MLVIAIFSTVYSFIIVRDVRRKIPLWICLWKWIVSLVLEDKMNKLKNSQCKLSLILQGKENRLKKSQYKLMY
jgi:hypothetical protein